MAWGPPSSQMQLLFLLIGQHLVFFVLRFVSVVGRTQDMPPACAPLPLPKYLQRASCVPGGLRECDRVPCPPGLFFLVRRGTREPVAKPTTNILLEGEA